jgi:hypothetical protein
MKPINPFYPTPQTTQHAASPVNRSGIELPPAVAEDLKHHLLEGLKHSIPAKTNCRVPSYMFKNYTNESIKKVLDTIQRIPEGSLRLIKSQYYPKRGEIYPPSIRLVFNRADGDYTHPIHQNIRQSRLEIARQFMMRHSNNPLFDKCSLDYDHDAYDATRAFYPLEERLTQAFINPHLSQANVEPSSRAFPENVARQTLL